MRQGQHIPHLVLRPMKGKVDDDVMRNIERLAEEMRKLRAETNGIKEAGYITADDATAKYGAQATRRALQIGGSHPHNVQGLVGVLSQPQLPGVDKFASDPPLSDPHSQDGVIIISGGTKKRFDATLTPPQWVVF